ncbi:MAG TPA: hypothetical protein VGH52_09195 [Gaiellaceae bacterium]|jgi:hypothetical protein
MDPTGDDLEFDFFEDAPPTTEAATRPRTSRGGGRPPRARRSLGPPRGLTPFVRLLAVIAIGIAVLVFFGLLLQSCASTSKHDKYSGYMNRVSVIARSSASDGNSVANALTTPGLKIADLQSKLSGIAEQERQNVNAAEHLNPPGPLRPENQQLIESLQLRVLGTQGLSDALGAAAASKSSSTGAATLAAQGERMLASDVVWDDLFLSPSKAEMQARNVSGVVAPESHFVTNPAMVTESSMSLLLQRLQGASTGGTPTGIHGTNLVSVKAMPGGTQLSPSTDLNQITASPNLGFDVVVHDGGNSQEVRIKVTLTIQRQPASGQAIVQTQTIPVIDPGQDYTVHFTKVDVGALIAEKAKLTIDVAPVSGEADKTNNSASYPVIFSLS